MWLFCLKVSYAAQDNHDGMVAHDARRNRLSRLGSQYWAIKSRHSSGSLAPDARHRSAAIAADHVGRLDALGVSGLTVIPDVISKD